jgi:hypothetical protein
MIIPVAALTLLDLVGLFGALAALFHADFFNPTANIGGWCLAVVGAGSLVFFAWWTGRHAGQAHNVLRDYLNDTQERGADQQEVVKKRRKRGRWLAFTAFVTAASAGVLIQRLFDTGGTMKGTWPVIIVLLGLLAAIGLPAVTFYSEAVNGTNLSRSIGPLREALSDGAERQRAALSEAEGALRFVRDALETLAARVNAIANAAQDSVNQSIRIANYVCIQASEPADFKPPAPQVHFQTNDAGGPWFFKKLPDTQPYALTPRIDCGLPHAEQVKTEQLNTVVEHALRVGNRLEALERQLAAVTRHVWLDRPEAAGSL